MMLVESYDRFGVVADFDPRSGALVQRAGPRLVPPSPGARGVYGHLGDDLAVLYRIDQDIWLRVGKFVHCFDRSGCEVGWRHDAGTPILTVRTQDGSVARFAYSNDLSWRQDDPTPFAEDADWDFGLYVWKVLNDGNLASWWYAS